MKRALWTLLVVAGLVLGACSSGGGVTLDPDTDAVGAADLAATGRVSCAEVGAGERSASDPTGCAPDPSRVVPALGYRCADGSMVYTTDTSHGRDGERWSVAYDAADELEQRC